MGLTNLRKSPVVTFLGGALLATALVGLTPRATSAQQATYNGNGEFAAHVRQFKRPHLTVVISIDQFRADYLRRLADLYLPAQQGSGKVGGFRYLMTQGSYFVDARYNHIPTFTGPGHAVILTGGSPYKTGIVGNDWFDKATHTPVYCVDDPRQKVVGAAAGSTAKPMGPLNLRSTTLGDELKLATGGASKVVTISLKDRAAILLGGHTQDVSLWYDDAGGRWISSTAYCKDGKLPAWVETLNTEAIPDKALGTVWTPSVSPEAFARTIAPNLPPKNEPYGMGRVFPHAIGKEKVKANYRAFTLTPAANAFVFTTAKRAVTAERLGQHGETPDLLALNLATNDYAGHAFGPYSPEALDVSVQTDHQIADFLNFLQTTVPGGLKEVVFVITADHGVAPIVENLQERDISAGRVLESSVADAVQKALVGAFGAGEWIGKGADGKPVGGYTEPYVYLNDTAIDQALASGKATSRAQVEETAARSVAALPGIYACYTRSQIMEGRLPQNDITRRVVNGFYPKVSGDIFVVSEGMYYTDPGTPGPYITTHGSPYAYDTHVPILIAGPGIRAGVWPDPVSPADIAPTLAALLGVELPSACDGTILKSALR
ncbi:MAG: type phosphodiesterase/nucleotide pyrophosphatase [Chthonomonadaceae bacterium]|nr:type phosphodiesterase/nucleotide pyrophosphatase [Chthonomonadaceae bacterium]